MPDAVVETHLVRLVWPVSPSLTSPPIVRFTAGKCTCAELFGQKHFLFLLIVRMVELPLWDFVAARGGDWLNTQLGQAFWQRIDWAGTMWLFFFFLNKLKYFIWHDLIYKEVYVRLALIPKSDVGFSIIMKFTALILFIVMKIVKGRLYCL